MRIPTVVIIGDHTQGLGIMRSAAAMGGEIWVVNDKAISLARFSRHLTQYKQIRRGTLARLHQPEQSERLLRALLELPVEYPSLLFSVNEDISHFKQQHAEMLRQRYFIPSGGLDRIYDKYLFNHALPVDVRISTRLCSEIRLEEVEEPEKFILKGRQGGSFRRLTGKKAVRLDQCMRDGGQRVFARLSPAQIMLQEIVCTDRPVLSICSFSVDGERVGRFAYEKLRQHPHDFGTGTYLRSVGPDPVEELADSVLQRYKYTGISEIECIYDCRTGSYRVIEMNPRAWKSVHFASQCGENLIARYIEFVRSGVVNRGSHYVRGKYWTDLATDIPQSIRMMKWGEYHSGMFECVWDKQDPWPAVARWTLFPLIALEGSITSL